MAPVPVFMFMAALIILVALALLLATRRRRRASGQPAKTLIVLGSGGHTAEMLKLVSSLQRQHYSPRVYVTAHTDRLSGQKAAALEKEINPQATDYELHSLPRSREVGQSYVTSVATTLKALLYAFAMVWRLQPELVLVNGPGTCIPLCFAAWLLTRARAIPPCSVVYVESIARVRKLSLSAKILYHTRIADRMLVQWEGLQAAHPRTVYAGRLY